MPRSTSVTFRLHRWSISISASTGHPHCCEVLSLCWLIPSVHKFRPLTPFYSLLPGVNGFQVVGDKRFVLEEERYNSHSDDGWICGLKSGCCLSRLRILFPVPQRRAADDGRELATHVTSETRHWLIFAVSQA